MSTIEHSSTYEQNVERIVAYLQSGCKTSQQLGVEFENILVKRGTKEAVSYEGRHGVKEILERLSAFYPDKLYDEGHLIGLAHKDATVTLEPAACLEYSAGPYTTATEAEESFKDFLSKLQPILDEFGLEMANLGYHPTACAHDLTLIPKQRYYAMDRYLSQFGRFGACMMRCSAALQVSIDYTSEADAIRKLRVANALSPLFSLLCDNSPIFEGRRTRHHMARTLVWSNYDPHRCMIIPGTFDEGFGFRDYAEFVMNTAAIVVPEKEGHWRYVGELTFDEVYADRLMEESEIEHALSIIFPDGRLKRFLEIRPADSLPLPYSTGYIALIKGLFYHEANVDMLSRELASVTEGSIKHAKRELIHNGYDADLGRHFAVAGTPAITTPQEWLTHLLDLAEQGLDPQEAAYLAPLRDLVENKATLASRYAGATPQPADIPRIAVFPRYSKRCTRISVSLGYINGILEAGGIPVILPFTDDPLYLEEVVELYDGFLIPGGHDVSPATYGHRPCEHTDEPCKDRDIMENTLVPLIVAADKPLLGICRGHQVINVALGGTLIQDVATSYPTNTNHEQQPPFDQPVHTVTVKPGTKLAHLLGETTITVNSIHHQAIDRVAEDLVVSASSDDGMIEAVEIPNKRFVVGVQWHPEHLWQQSEVHHRLFKGLVQACKDQGDMPA